MRKGTKRARRDRVFYIQLPTPIRVADRTVERIKVTVWAEPEPLTADFGKDLPRGVYICIRGDTDALTNQYAIIDSRRRQIATFDGVPEQPTAWHARNDAARIHEGARDLVLHEAWKILLHKDPVRAPADERGLTGQAVARAPYRGFFPYPGSISEGGVFRPTPDFKNECSREIAVSRDEGAVQVRLEQHNDTWDYIELSIGGNYAQTGRGIGDYQNRADDDPSLNLYWVHDMRALEQLHSALGDAIVKAKEDRWPLPG